MSALKEPMRAGRRRPQRVGPVAGHDKQLIDALADRGWAVRAETDFAVADRSAPALRVTTSTMGTAAAREFAADLANAI